MTLPFVTVRAVLFDYGGTLVREREPWKEAKPRAVYSAYEVLRRAGLKLAFEEYIEVNDTAFKKTTMLELKESRDIPDVITYKDIVDSLFQSQTEAWRRKAAIQAEVAFWATATKNFALRRGARPMLKRLKVMKLRMAVLSNHRYPMAEVEHLNRLRIAPYFSRIMISAQVGLRKPDPRFFRKCLSSVRVSPDEAVFVGDSPAYDVQGAKRAGMHSILFAGDGSSGWNESADIEPDFIVHDLAEVPNVVSSLSGELNHH